MSQSRIGRFGAIVLATIVTLVGCGTNGDEMARRLAEVARGVSGVQSVDLTYTSGAGNSRTVDGAVTLTTSDKAEGIAVLDQIYAAMAPLLKNEDSVFGLRFTTTTATGERIYPQDLGFQGSPSGFELTERYG